MTKPKPNAQRVDIAAEIMSRLKVSREEAERLAALPPGEVSALDFAALRLLNLDGSDPREDYIEANAAYTFARSAHEEAAPIVRQRMRSTGALKNKREAADKIEKAFAIVDQTFDTLSRADATNKAASETNLSERQRERLGHYYDALALGASPDAARAGSEKGKWRAFKQSLK